MGNSAPHLFLSGKSFVALHIYNLEFSKNNRSKLLLFSMSFLSLVVYLVGACLLLVLFSDMKVPLKGASFTSTQMDANRLLTEGEEAKIEDFDLTLGTIVAFSSYIGKHVQQEAKIWNQRHNT